MYFVLQSLVTRISHFNSEMYQLLQIWNHPEDLYVEEEDCDEVAGDWEEEIELQHEVGHWRWIRFCANSRINYLVTCANNTPNIVNTLRYPSFNCTLKTNSLLSIEY